MRAETKDLLVSAWRLFQSVCSLVIVAGCGVWALYELYAGDLDRAISLFILLTAVYIGSMVEKL